MSTHFIFFSNSFLKVFSQLLLLFSRIAGMGRIPLWYYSSLCKLREYHPSFINVFVALLFHKNPTWL
jgi:hypothetical protein